MKKKIVIELSSGKRIEMSEEEYEELQKALGEKETIVFKPYPTYPLYPSFPTYPYYPYNWCTTTTTATISPSFIQDCATTTNCMINSDDKIFLTW